MNEQTALDKVFGMMKVAKDQQEAVKTALDGLAAERAAWVAALTQQAAAIKNAARDVVPAIEKAAGTAVRQTLAGASSEAATALREATGPVVERLASVAQAAGSAEASIKRAGQWFAWKWVALAASGVAGLLVVAYSGLGWQQYQISSLREEKAALQADIAELKADVAKLEKRGGRIVMAQCGGRLCIEVSSNQGKDDSGNTIQVGGWKNNANGVKLVIPRGY